MSRNGTSGTIQSDNGRSHGSVRRPGVGARSRNSGTLMLDRSSRAQSSVEPLAGLRVEQVHNAFGSPVQPDGVGQPGRPAWVAARNQVDSGARVRVDVGLTAEVLDQVDDDLD